MGTGIGQVKARIMLPRALLLMTMLLMACVAVGGQTLGDLCRVTVTDVQLYERVGQAIMNKASDSEVVKLMRLSTKEVGTFVTDAGFQRETTKSFPFPGSKLVIQATASYSHRRVGSAVNYSPTMRVEVVVGQKAKGSEPLATAATETGYSQFTGFIDTQTWVEVRGRVYDVIVSCDTTRRPEQK